MKMLIFVIVFLLQTIYYEIIASPIPLQWQLCPYRDTSTFIQHCIPAKVPGTVLSNLIRHNNTNQTRRIDPYFERNLQKIPDISVVGREAYTFSYQTQFEIKEPRPKTTAQYAWLMLRSINYEAKVSLNDIPVMPTKFLPSSSPSSSTIRGMFQRFLFSFGRIIPNQIYNISILVHPPLHPGLPNNAQGGSNHAQAQDGPIVQYTGGWDWIQATPDRNTGLWDEVAFHQISQRNWKLLDGNVEIKNIDIRNQRADLHFSISLISESDSFLEEDNSAVLLLEYYPIVDGISSSSSTSTSKRRVLRQLIKVSSSSSTTTKTQIVKFPKEAATKVQFWYPHTHGNPALYRAKMQLLTPTNENNNNDEIIMMNEKNKSVVLIDEYSFQFGIRQVDIHVNTTLNGIQVWVNEEPVFLQGGNWITTDQLLKYSKQRYTDEIRLHASMGFNMIRVWGGGIAERTEFFQACDEWGVLVLQDFWMTGDNNGRWAGSYDWPLDYSLFLQAVQDTIVRLRNHPSLIIYSAGNELYPTKQSPPSPIWNGIKEAIAKYDSSNTFLIRSTMTNASNFNLSESLCPKDGPYGLLLDEEWYQERNPGVYDWQNNSYIRISNFSFQPEVGSVSFPTLTSLLRFMTSTSANAIPNDGVHESNIHPTWHYHKFETFRTVRSNLTIQHMDKYGPVSNISEYCVRAQLVQYTQYKSLFEGYQGRMWQWYTAVLFWKSQSPWPSLRGGLYDYYLGMTGGYYGVKTALFGEGGTKSRHHISNSDYHNVPSRKRHVRAQINLADHTLTVITSSQAVNVASICVIVKAIVLPGRESGKQLWSDSFWISNLTPNQAKQIHNSTIPWVGSSEQILLYRVETYYHRIYSKTSCGSSLAQWQQHSPAHSVDYWLRDWNKKNITQRHDFSQLGMWRDDTSQYVRLAPSARWCDLNDALCQQVGCIDNQILLQLAHTNNGHTAVAFAIWIELHHSPSHHTNLATNFVNDTRVLPTEYSQGLFSMLHGEEQSVCIIPYHNHHQGKMEIQISGWNVEAMVVPVPKRRRGFRRNGSSVTAF